MKTKFLLFPVFVFLLVLGNGCTKPKVENDNGCVTAYQERMKKIKEDREAAVKNCQNAGGSGTADCIARVTSESEKLEKAALDEFNDCVKGNH